MRGAGNQEMVRCSPLPSPPCSTAALGNTAELRLRTCPGALPMVQMGGDAKGLQRGYPRLGSPLAKGMMDWRQSLTNLQVVQRACQIFQSPAKNKGRIYMEPDKLKALNLCRSHQMQKDSDRETLDM